ncbi:MAG: O-antigen ligase family protein [Candidatus Omnitrophota bacterium]
MSLSEKITVSTALVISLFTLYCSYTSLWFLPIGALFFIGCGVALIALLPLITQKVCRLFAQINLLHAIWILLLVGSLTFRIRTGYQLMQNPVDEAAFFRIAIVILAGIIILPRFIIKLGDNARELFSGTLLFFTLYVLAAVFSFIYSSYHMLTLWKGFELFLDLCVIAMLFSDSRYFKNIILLMNLSWFLLACLMSVMWLGWILFPGWASTPSDGIIRTQLGGVLVSANGVGIIGAMIATVGFSRMMLALDRKNRMLYFIIFFISVVTIIVSQSRTALLAVFVSLAVVAFLQRRPKVIVTVLCSAFVFLIIYYFCQNSLSRFAMEFFRRGQNIGQLQSLTGRTFMWKKAWELIRQNVFLGYGFGAGSRITFMMSYSKDFTWIHNAWIEVMLNLGLLGLIPFFAAFLSAWRELVISFFSKKVSLSEGGLSGVIVENIGVMSIITLGSITGSAIGAWQTYDILIYISILAFANLLHKIRLST